MTLSKEEVSIRWFEITSAFGTEDTAIERHVKALKAHFDAQRAELEKMHDMLPKNHKHDANGLHVKEESDD